MADLFASVQKIHLLKIDVDDRESCLGLQEACVAEWLGQWRSGGLLGFLVVY